jgi:hypothetical protein
MFRLGNGCHPQKFERSRRVLHTLGKPFDHKGVNDSACAQNNDFSLAKPITQA